MRPRCCDQPETLTQSYYPRIDSIAINAVPRHREVAPVNKHCRTNKQKTDVVVGVTRAQRWAGGTCCCRLRTRQVPMSCFLCTFSRLSSTQEIPFFHPRFGPNFTAVTFRRRFNSYQA